MYSGQHIAITGARGGIGKAIGERLASLGARVSLSDLAAPHETAQEIGAAAYICDVSDEASVQNFIQSARADHGPIDIYVSNAGVGFGDGGHAANASNANWETSWQVNLMGSVYAARALLPDWRQRGSGRFVITASAAGLLTQIGSAPYTATKHAAVGFAESLAISHWDEGIRTHCICPQYVRTNMTKGLEMAKHTPGGLLEPSDVADALIDAIGTDRFMVMPHAIIRDYFKHKAMDYEAYIQGMVKLKQKVGQPEF